MRRYLIPVLFLALAAGCSTVKIGPHRIDVQQGNALDQENVARLKTGLNRSQVRFLLGTPLVVDPFRTDRWDYVYVLYKAGKLAEQKRITLFFEGDTLARIEGDLPEPAVQAPPAQSPNAEPAATAPAPLVEPAAPVPAPVPTPTPKTEAAQPEPVATQPAPVNPPPARPAVVELPAAAARTAPAAAQPDAPAKPGAVPASTVVLPLESPKNLPAYVDPRPPAAPALQAETDVTRIQPDVIPPFPAPSQAAPPSDDPVLKAVDDWAKAWAARDGDKYIAAYDADFTPQGGGSRADWEKRRRLLLEVAKNIELKIDSPSVERADDGSATVTFNQFYRSDSYRDAVVKQVRLAEHGGRWLIVEEKVLSVLHGVRP